MQEMLDEYEGTVLLVSHDRDFMDRVVTPHYWSMDQGMWDNLQYGFSDMVAQGGWDPQRGDGQTHQSAQNLRP